MGKGDVRSKRGKIVIGSFGVKRLKKSYMKTVVEKVQAENKSK